MNNNLKNHKTLFKIIMLIIDIIAIIILALLFIKWNSSKNDSDTNLKEINYKKFTFQIPQEMSYSEVDNKKFKLVTSNYEAIIEIFVDEANYMFEKRDKYYHLLLDDGYNVDNSYEETINGIPVLIYNKHIDDNSNSILCYFRINSPFSAEIELINNDGSLKKDALNELVNIIYNNSYDYQSTEKFEYYSTENDPTYKD